MKHFSILPPKTVLTFLVLFFACACTDSDQFLFNETENTEFIKVEATVTTSFDSTASRSKADTIKPGDSLIFLTNVIPSKSIRNQEYFWTLDGKLFSNEFSVKSTIKAPGIHDVEFVFVDFFGDTLKDSLTITVASPPQLDNVNYIPASLTQGIRQNDFLRFVWRAYDPDSMWNLHSRFTLQEEYSDSLLVDTLLDSPQFIYTGHLKTLQKYTWQVSVQNQFGQAAEQQLEGIFYTTGIDGENALCGKLETSTRENDFTFQVLLTDSAQQTLYKKKFKSSDSHFSIKPLPEGSYTLYTLVEDYPDFKPDTLDITLRGGTVREIPSITFYDSIPPTIESLTSSDTLDIADTLHFKVYDGGGTLQLSKIRAMLDSHTLTGLSLSHDTLAIPLDPSALYWSYRIIAITLADNSENKTQRKFYLRPNATLPEVFSE